MDWHRNQELLLKDSEPLILALFTENEDRGDVIAAIGYVFEFGRGQLCFELCANTARHSKESQAKYRTEWPSEPIDEFRWNSGDYDYPGAVQDRFGGWSTAWWDELSRLDSLSADEGHSKVIHDGIANICCHVLAELAKRGAFGDWSVIDFNVAALLDDIEQVKKRDALIRDFIRTKT